MTLEFPETHSTEMWGGYLHQYYYLSEILQPKATTYLKSRQEDR